MLVWDQDVDVNGTEHRGYFFVDLSFGDLVERLKALSGQDPTEYAFDKMTVEFVGTFDGQPFALYDYKGDREIHIGGTRALDVVGLQRALLERL